MPPSAIARERRGLPPAQVPPGPATGVHPWTSRLRRLICVRSPTLRRHAPIAWTRRGAPSSTASRRQPDASPTRAQLRPGPPLRPMDTMYSHTSQDIRITVEPYYLDDQSSPSDDHYVWAYHVKIENVGEATVQLINRYWKITDANGQIQEVRGSGVVGEQPVLDPGESFEYTSGTPLGHAVGHHGRHLRDGDPGRRTFRRGNPGLFPGQPTPARATQLASAPPRDRGSARVSAPVQHGCFKGAVTRRALPGGPGAGPRAGTRQAHRPTAQAKP